MLMCDVMISCLAGSDVVKPSIRNVTIGCLKCWWMTSLFNLHSFPRRVMAWSVCLSVALSLFLSVFFSCFTKIHINLVCWNNRFNFHKGTATWGEIYSATQSDLLLKIWPTKTFCMRYLFLFGFVVLHCFRHSCLSHGFCVCILYSLLQLLKVIDTIILTYWLDSTLNQRSKFYVIELE